LPIEAAPDSSLDVIRTHGRLYFAYQKCVGTRTLKAAYLPPTMHWYNWALWIVTFLPPLILGILQYIGWHWAWTSPLIQSVVTLGIYVPLGRLCIRWGLPEDYASVGIIGDSTLQPKAIHGPIMRLKWFKDLVTAREELDHARIKRAIEFVELIGKDAPPSSTSYFRHPLPLAILGIVVVTVNYKITALVQSALNAGTVMATIGLIAAWALGLGWLLYSLRYSAPQDRWSFLRALRWLELSMRPQEKPGDLTRPDQKD
jgi:hypothetical protein